MTMNKSKILRFISFSFALLAFVLISGSWHEARAQRDPFAKPSWAKQKTERQRPSSPSSQSSPGLPGLLGLSNPSNPSSPAAQPEKPKGPVVVAAPPIEQRIDYYKQLREQAAVSGLEIPKVTSVLTLEEMSVTGIFKTPRGPAAIIEAKPINLSYTVYPGDKFFDGQVVAIEENKVVFRKVTKLSNNKFISTVENKTLRQYSIQQEVQGTAPIQAGTDTTEAASNTPPAEPAKNPNPAVLPKIVSPLDEIDKQPKDKAEDSAKSGKKDKTVKVAKGKKP